MILESLFIFIFIFPILLFTLWFLRLIKSVISLLIYVLFAKNKKTDLKFAKNIFKQSFKFEKKDFIFISFVTLIFVVYSFYK